MENDRKSGPEGRVLRGHRSRRLDSMEVWQRLEARTRELLETAERRREAADCLYAELLALPYPRRSADAMAAALRQRARAAGLRVEPFPFA